MNLEGFNKLLNVFLPCVIDSTLEFINVDIMQRRPLTKQLCFFRFSKNINALV